MLRTLNFFIYGVSYALLILLLLLAITLPGPRPKTILSLSATGTSITAPDEMTASLTVQATAPAAAAAQAQVNGLMAKALAAAKAVPSVSATTGAYSVYQPDANNPGYQASQALDLTMPAPGGAPPPDFTGLVGGLQQDGLLLNNLDGQLSPAGQNHASQEATTDALQRLRAQAAAVAATLDDSVGPIKTVSIDGGSPVPMPMGKMMMAMASPPPQSAPVPITVQVTMNATVELKPLKP